MSVCLSENIGKKFIKFVSLNILSMLAMSFYILADTMFVANGVGEDGLTALNIVLPFFSLLNGTGVLLGIGGATRYSIAKGADNKEVEKRIFTTVLILGCVFGALYTFIGLVFPTEVCYLLGADESIIDLATTYLWSLSICNLPFVVNHIILTFVRNDNAPKLAMLAVVGSSLFNILFDYILIYPCNLGIFGASFATGFSSVVSILILSFHFIRKKNTFRLVKPEFRLQDIKQTIFSGFPSMVAELSNGTVILVFNKLIYELGGNIAINAYSVVANLSLVAMFTFNGVSQGVQPLFSYNYGAKNQGNINKIYIFGLLTALGLAAIYFVSFYFGRDFLISLFNKENNQEMTTLARDAITLYNTAYFCAGLNIISTALFATCGKPMFSFIISTLRGLILPISYAFLMSSLLGLKGIWITVMIAEVTTFVVTIVFVFINFYKLRRSVCKD